jgi:arabinofuranosyltransferase
MWDSRTGRLLRITPAAAAFALLAARFWWVNDDAYIAFRYARNWVEGRGLVFNPGDAPPVEGYTDFLWVLLSAVVEVLGGDPGRWMPVVSFACGLALLGSLYRILEERLGLEPPVPALALLWLACLPPFAVWATSGLETMPFALLILLAFDQAVLARDAASAARGGIFALLLSLLRFDGIAFAILIGILALVARFRRDGEAQEIARRYFPILLAGFLVYFAWRWAYHGSLLPNTARAKVSPGPDLLLRGARYVLGFPLIFLSPLIFLPGLREAARPARRADGIPVLLFLAGVAGYCVAVGGDWMPMGRFLVPGLVLFVLPVAWMLESLCARGGLGRVAAHGLLAAAILLGLLPGWNIHVVPQSIRALAGVRLHDDPERFRSELEQWKLMRANVPRWRRLAEMVRERSAPGDTIVRTAIGVVGYYSGLHVLDRAGLVSREVADREVTGELRTPGHDKLVEHTWFLPSNPAYLDARYYDQACAGRSLLGRVENWERWGVADRYAPELVPDDAGPGTDGRGLLILLHRAEQAERQDSAWREFRRRIDALPPCGS